MKNKVPFGSIPKDVKTRRDRDVEREDYMKLPEDMKIRNQWCIAWWDDKAPAIPDSSSPYGFRRTSTVSGPWLSFEDAIKLAYDNWAYIGFVLTPNDPLMCIDFDIKDYNTVDKDGNRVDRSKHTAMDKLQSQQRMVKEIPTYAELSQSRKGAHLWMYGTVDRAIKCDWAEVYDRDRFMICTGAAITEFNLDVGYKNDDLYVEVHSNYCEVEEDHNLIRPLMDDPYIVEDAVSYIRQFVKSPTTVETNHNVDKPEKKTDNEIIRTAMTAANGEKFDKLFNGKWKWFDFPSQSEADYALLSMLCFYSDNDAQVRRIFRKSVLGMRPKADHRPYLNRAINKIRASQYENISDVDAYISSLKVYDGDWIIDNAKDKKYHVTKFPQGLTGEIAKYIYDSSPRPVKEIALSAAMSLMAGVCGKVYNVSNTGLNMYTILVARSGVGKEAIHSGISSLMNKVCASLAGADIFVDQSRFQSSNALVKKFEKRKSFLNLVGEIGQFFEQASSSYNSSFNAAAGLKNTLNDIYTKSGADSVVGGLSYSNKENDTGNIKGVAYSLLGDTTPGQFFDNISEKNMADGFMSRLTIMNYTGDRNPLNADRLKEPPSELIDKMCSLCKHVIDMMERHITIPVTENDKDGVSDRIKEFDLLCDEKINATTNEAIRQLWNRAHLKTIRLAALFAVGRNPWNPIICLDDFQYALNITMGNIDMFLDLMKSGEVGANDIKKQVKAFSIILERYADIKNYKIAKSHNVPANMRKKLVISRSYISNALFNYKVFSKSRIGYRSEVNQIIEEFIDNGYLVKLDKFETKQMFNTTAVCYQIKEIPEFD